MNGLQQWSPDITANHLALPLEFLIEVLGRGGFRILLLPSSQVMLILLVGGPYFEIDCLRPREEGTCDQFYDRP